jgi:hypothetical protein
MNTSFSSSQKPYLAALGHLGQVQDSERALARLMAIQPEFSVAGFIAGSPFERDEDLQCVVAGLRLAGVPEHPPAA